MEINELIRTRKLEITDSNGKTRIDIGISNRGSPQIILRDSSGKPSVRIDVDEENRPSIVLNASGSMMFTGIEIEGMTFSSNQLSLTQAGETMALNIGGFTNRISVFINDRDESSIYLSDKDNNVKLALTDSFDKGPGNVLIIDSDKIIKSLL